MKKSQLSASSYLYLKEKEERNDEFKKSMQVRRNILEKNEDAKRGLKVAFIFLIIAGAFTLTIISTTLSIFLLR